MYAPNIRFYTVCGQTMPTISSCKPKPMRTPEVPTGTVTGPFGHPQPPTPTPLLKPLRGIAGDMSAWPSPVLLTTGIQSQSTLPCSGSALGASWFARALYRTAYQTSCALTASVPVIPQYCALTAHSCPPPPPLDFTDDTGTSDCRGSSPKGTHHYSILHLVFSEYACPSVRCVTGSPSTCAPCAGGPGLRLKSPQPICPSDCLPTAFLAPGNRRSAPLPLKCFLLVQGGGGLLCCAAVPPRS